MLLEMLEKHMSLVTDHTAIVPTIEVALDVLY